MNRVTRRRTRAHWPLADVDIEELALGDFEDEGEWGRVDDDNAEYQRFLQVGCPNLCEGQLSPHASLSHPL